jgi:hypothetical protein
MIRYKWITEDKSKDETFFQFEIQQDEITGDVALIVTDFASDDEKAGNMMLWDSQIHALMHHIGS